jgi:hypothetical protein
LGFLAGPVPNPMLDPPEETHATSDAHEDVLVRFLTAVFREPSLARFRPELAEHLRQTYSEAAYELHPVEVMCAVTRLGWMKAEEVLGQSECSRLATAFVVALTAPPARFEELAGFPLPRVTFLRTMREPLPWPSWIVHDSNGIERLPVESSLDRAATFSRKSPQTLVTLIAAMRSSTFSIGAEGRKGILRGVRGCPVGC